MEGYKFDHWSGDFPKGREESREIIITMDSDKRVTAYFTGLYPPIYGFPPWTTIAGIVAAIVIIGGVLVYLMRR